MDDVSQENEARWFVIGDQGAEAIESVVFGDDGHELALRAMGPGVTEMQIGDGKEFVFAKIDGAAGVENDAEQEFQRLKDGRTDRRH
jgi:hypothetical protein